MGNTEDYLDSLLNSINNSGRTGKNRGSESDLPMEDADEAFRRFEREQEYKREQRRRREEEMRREREFLEEFEGELEGEDADDFLQQYELEFEVEDDLDGTSEGDKESSEDLQEMSSNDPEQAGTEDSRTAAEESEENPLMPEPQEEVDPEEPEENPLMPEDTPMEEAPKEPEYAVEEPADENEGDADLLSLLSGLDDDDEISGLDSLLEAGQEEAESDKKQEEESTGKSQDGKHSDENKKGKKEKKSKDKKAEKKGFFGKLSTALFGEEEEESDEILPKKDLENLSEEEQKIVKELEAAGKTEEKGNSKEEKKKKKEEKKEKKREKKEEKAEKKKEKKERKEEKKKQKPPKPPKEADNAPPLPKKPMFLIFLLAFSLMAFVLLIMKTTGYSSQISAANQAMDNGEYVKAYQDLSGLELKEKDKSLYEKAGAMALVQSQYNAYLTLMGANEYDMALDALIRGIKRCEKEAETAKKYGLEKELNAQREQLEQALNNQFGMSAKQAKELYEIRDREEYSIRIADIINKMNLGQVEE